MLSSNQLLRCVERTASTISVLDKRHALDFGKVHFEGDHHVRVVRVFKRKLVLDSRFDIDFNTAFTTGPARPHGVAMK